MMVPPSPPCLGLARVGGLICEQRPATLSSSAARKQNSAGNEARPLYRETTRLDLGISQEVTSFTPLARTEPVLYFPHLLLLLFPQALLLPNPRAHNQGLGLLLGPLLAWGPELSSSGPTALEGHMPSSFLECWLPLLPAWALYHFLSPLPCLSQIPLIRGQGGHGGARHPIR